MVYKIIDDLIVVTPLGSGTTRSYTFTATMTGKVLIKITTSSSYYDDYFKYWFQID